MVSKMKFLILTVLSFGLAYYKLLLLSNGNRTSRLHWDNIFNREKVTSSIQFKEDLETQIYQNWISNEAVKCSTLTQHGYLDLIFNIRNERPLKWRFLKRRLNIAACSLVIRKILLHTIMYISKALEEKQMMKSMKINLWIWYLSCERTVFFNFLLNLYFLLIIGGIETNPGPPKLNEVPPSKRVRKTGHIYCTYLTERDSLDNAPAYFKKDMHKLASGSFTQEQVLNLKGDDSTSIAAGQSNVPNEQILTGNFHDNCQVNFKEDDGAMQSDGENSYGYSSSSEESFLSETPYSSEDDNEHDHNLSEDLKDTPIYEGAKLSTGASMLLIMTYVLEHNLTGDAFSDLLHIISLHCKENNTIPVSTHLFKKWFQNLKTPPKKHTYCSSCFLSIEDDFPDTCANQLCGKRFKKKSDKSFFVEISMVEQLKKLVYNFSFREKLQFRFKREKKLDGNVEDIYDGHHYKAFNELFSSQNNISFMWNTDGIPLFKSSNTSLWPLYFAVNELPFKMRRNPENLLLAGLWIGPKKPEMLTFLKPFIKDLEKLEKGIEMETDLDDTIIVKAFLMAGTADLPAKCAVCNMTQYNGLYSCPHCIQPGQTAAAGKGRCHIFPFQFDNPTGPRRSLESSLEMAQSAADTGRPVYGIKGPCWFTKLKDYNFVTGNCIDYMHCVLLGTTKRLIYLWFSKDTSGKTYSCFRSLEKVNGRLENIKPPLNIKRKPRSINDLKYWKAAEFRSWLLCYAPVVLRDVLKFEYYIHFLLLSNAIYILLKDSISSDEINAAENLLEHFVARFSDLYEERYLTLNVHLLLHLPENVRQLGPLWAYSCFPFEDANGYLLKLIKGTQSVEAQIIDTISVIHGIHFLEKHCIESGSREEVILKKIKKLLCGIEYILQDDIVALGKVNKISVNDLSHDCYISVANLLNKPLNGTIRTFKRLKINNKIFHSQEYTRVKVRNSYTIKYSTGLGNVSYGFIQFYIQYTSFNGDDHLVLAIVNPLTLNREAEFRFPYDKITEQRLMEHIVVCNNPNYSSQSVAVAVTDIIDLCVKVNMEENNLVYLCSSPNLLEKD